MAVYLKFDVFTYLYQRFVKSLQIHNSRSFDKRWSPDKDMYRRVDNTEDWSGWDRLRLLGYHPPPKLSLRHLPWQLSCKLSQCTTLLHSSFVSQASIEYIFFLPPQILDNSFPDKIEMTSF